jgi:hypothetical protein
MFLMIRRGNFLLKKLLFSGRLNENGKANVSINPNIQTNHQNVKAAFITKCMKTAAILVPM